MTAYQLNHGYAATRDGLKFGPWEAGDVVDLEPDDAAWIQRDSPGALTEAKPERAARPAADRQHRGGRNRGA